MSEELAIIREPGCGRRDLGHPVMFFDVVGEGWSALQVFEINSEEGQALLGSVYSIEKLDGKPCMVEKADGIVRFKRLVKA